MPLPVIVGLASAVSAVFTARNAYIAAGFLTVFKDEILGAVYQALEGEGLGGWLAQVANQKLDAAGLDLRFRDLLDVEKVKADVDAFAARRVNVKAGTSFTSLKDIDRDAFLTEVSKVLATRVNQASGSKIVAMWPVDRLRDELATELARQFQPGVDLAVGGLFPVDKLQAIELNIANKFNKLTPSPNVASGAFTFWPPPRDDKQAVVRALGRERQAKYRNTHKQVWVDK